MKFSELGNGSSGLKMGRLRCDVSVRRIISSFVLDKIAKILPWSRNLYVGSLKSKATVKTHEPA